MKINILVLIILIVLLCKIVDGYKKGMVREIISVISLICLCIVAALIGNGVNSYLHGELINAVFAVLLLVLLSIAHHFLNLLLFPAKLISKLPVVHFVDKLLGIAVGVLETILILWTIYTFIIIMDTGMIGIFIQDCTAENPVLTWLYEHNQLAGWIERLL